MFQCPLESGDVGCSQSQFTFTFYHEKAVGKLLLQGLYNGGGPVRRTVLDDQNMKGLFQSENGADDVLYVFPFVVVGMITMLSDVCILCLNLKTNVMLFRY